MLLSIHSVDWLDRDILDDDAGEDRLEDTVVAELAEDEGEGLMDEEDESGPNWLHITSNWPLPTPAPDAASSTWCSGRSSLTASSSFFLVPTDPTVGVDCDLRSPPAEAGAAYLSNFFRFL